MEALHFSFKLCFTVIDLMLGKPLFIFLILNIYLHKYIYILYIYKEMLWECSCLWYSPILSE